MNIVLISLSVLIAFWMAQILMEIVCYILALFPYVLVVVFSGTSATRLFVRDIKRGFAGGIWQDLWDNTKPALSPFKPWWNNQPGFTPNRGEIILGFTKMTLNQTFVIGVIGFGLIFFRILYPILN